MNQRFHKAITVSSLTVFGVIGAMVAGCSHHTPAVTQQPSHVNKQPRIVAPQGSFVTVYSLGDSGSDANGLVPVRVRMPAGAQDPARIAIDTLASMHESPLPRGTRLRSLKLDNAGTATLDFSSKFVDNFPGGDAREAQVVGSILQTMGQFPSVHTVQLLVDGKKIESLGGNLSLDEPLAVVTASSSRGNDADGGRA